MQKKIFMFLPWISILTQKNSTRPRVTTNPSLSILFNTVPFGLGDGKAAHEGSGQSSPALLYSDLPTLRGRVSMFIIP